MFQSFAKTAGAPEAYQIDFSCVFSGVGDYFAKTDFGAISDGTKAITSVWAKRTGLGQHAIIGSGNTAADFSLWQFGGTNLLEFLQNAASATVANISSVAAFTTLGVWDHFLFSYDSATPSMEYYVNGVLIALTITTPVAGGQQLTFMQGGGTFHRIGATSFDNGANFNGLMSQFLQLDGQSFQNGDHVITDFGEDVGGWRPIDLTLITARGNNGTLLMFDDNTTGLTLGLDHGAGVNDWAVVGLTSGSQSTDTPTNPA